jgi:hypothetical protein
MQTYTEYIALHALRAPGTLTYGYREGDGVPAGTVENWELVVGVDVMPRDTGVIARPDGDDRAAWEAYAIGQGTSPDEARAASLAELKKTPEPAVDAETGGPVVLPDPNAAPERPAPDAKKADWVAFVVATGADEAWANDRSTTKADLQDYTPSRDVTPSVGDPVAVSLSAAQAGAVDEPQSAAEAVQD